MAAALLTGEPLRLLNVPRLADIASMASLMRQHGVRIDRSNGLAGGGSIAAGDDLTLSADELVSTVAPYDLVRKVRPSGAIGRATGRERGCQYVEIAVGAGKVKTKKKK